jgi:AbrB family looped-hinge helix DNA binding protein
MGDEVIMVMVSDDGRITIPADYRKALGLAAGGVAVARCINGEIRIRPVRAVLAELEAKNRKHVAKRVGNRALPDSREDVSSDAH